MRVLPESTWLSLHEAAELVREQTGKELGEIWIALPDAFEDETIRVVARCPTCFRHERRGNVNSVDWGTASIHKQKNEFYTPGGEVFYDVGVHRGDLLDWLSQAPSASKAAETASDQSQLERPTYRSPFIDLLLQAEAHFCERLETIKAEELRLWLNERGKAIDPRWSDTKANMMATFLRHPDLQKGGNKPR